MSRFSLEGRLAWRDFRRKVVGLVAFFVGRLWACRVFRRQVVDLVYVLFGNWSISCKYFLGTGQFCTRTFGELVNFVHALFGRLVNFVHAQTGRLFTWRKKVPIFKYMPFHFKEGRFRTVPFATLVLCPVRGWCPVRGPRESRACWCAAHLPTAAEPRTRCHTHRESLGR